MVVDTRLDREFGFTPEDFESVRTRLNQHAGIVLSDIKKDMVYNRLARRLRSLGLQNIRDYLNLLDDSNRGKEEFIHFINALTTNLTSFFREPHHFQYLEQSLLPELMRSKSDPIRVWSAGCSIGEEPYTLALVLNKVLAGRHPAQIQATDIDTNVLEVARQGIYDQERVKKLSQEQLKRGFLRGKGKQRGMVKVKHEIRSLIQFQPLNLIADWSIKGPFDVIFCRNVMIYFDKATQKKLIARMAELLTPNGHLFIGHSESLHNISDRFEPIGQTIYRRRG
ncbi:MAG: protein-glutamate O-methyltransferase [Motiliproteus sp.]|nr:protein-glutamate O-methyltransferase [Motiliproteus sp.]